MIKKHVHFLMCPFTGLGMYNGFRGNRWLRNRIKIFKQFVVPSLLAQTSQDFILWVSWRYEEKYNKQVIELKKYLDETGLRNVFTYGGVCFYDDKHEDNVARNRLVENLHASMPDLINVIGEADYVYLTIQPSDDVYYKRFVADIAEGFEEDNDIDALGFTRGYIMNYRAGQIKEWNPVTNPPFYTIKFKREDFLDPIKHCEFTSIKKDVGKYKAGTPIPSHEYVGDALKYKRSDYRGFLVGTHLDNISTVFKHPYAGNDVSKKVLEDFGLENVPLLKVKFSFRKKILKALPYKVQRKLRYIFGEKLFNKIYEFLRN